MLKKIYIPKVHITMLRSGKKPESILMVKGMITRRGIIGKKLQNVFDKR
jgi:hypothetical protein